MGNQHGSGFDKNSTAEQVARDISLVGKNVIITGANTGLGKETARVLAKMGGNIIMACRNMEKGAEAKAEIEGLVPNAQLTLLKLDLSNLQSIESFVQTFNELNIPVSLLINNAGIMAIPYQHTANGIEKQFGVNYLGHFHLTNLLLPKLIEGEPSRVVSLSSVAHRFSGIHWSDIDGRKSWYKDSVFARWNAYGQSKTADLLFAVELNRRMHAAGHKITANAVHPGVIHTELMRDLGTIDSFVMAMGKPFSKTVPQGAATSVYVATAPELEGIGGRYFADCNEETPRDYACDPRCAARLWEISEEMINKAPTDVEYAAKAEQQKQQKEQKEQKPQKQQKQQPQDDQKEPSQPVESAKMETAE